MDVPLTRIEVQAVTPEGEGDCMSKTLQARLYRVWHLLLVMIERYLAYAEREWSAVPQYVQEFDSWDSLEQLDFVHEWAIRESALEVLDGYAEQGAMTDDQTARFQGLRIVATRNRPHIEPLLDN